MLARGLPALLVAVLPLVAAAQAKNAPPKEKVEEAIRRGADWLLDYAPDFGNDSDTSELVVLTLLHADVSIDNEFLVEGIKHVRALDVEGLPFKHRTYRVALAAMALQTFGQASDQPRIARFAQFLVYNQCEDGTWSYGENITLPLETKTPGQTPSGKVPPPGSGFDGLPKVPIPFGKRIGGPKGDHSNTQFALLGLRACAEAGCVIPERTWKEALRAIEGDVLPDGSWGYNPSSRGTGAGAGNRDKLGYGSMTTSGICDLVICAHYLKEDWKKKRQVVDGLGWLAEHFSVTENPNFAEAHDGGPGKKGRGSHLYYYLYSLERTGALADTDRIGTHDWYAEGAEYLLGEQGKKGAWVEVRGEPHTTDTCFAILFLRRATTPIVPRRATK